MLYATHTTDSQTDCCDVAVATRRRATPSPQGILLSFLTRRRVDTGNHEKARIHRRERPGDGPHPACSPEDHLAYRLKRDAVSH